MIATSLALQTGVSRISALAVRLSSSRQLDRLSLPYLQIRLPEVGSQIILASRPSSDVGKKMKISTVVPARHFFIREVALRKGGVVP